jgi:hypothetical protein
VSWADSQASSGIEKLQIRELKNGHQMLFSQVSRAGSQASSRAASKAVSRGDTSHDRGKDMAGRVVAMAALRSKDPSPSKSESPHPESLT